MSRVEFNPLLKKLNFSQPNTTRTLVSEVCSRVETHFDISKDDGPNCWILRIIFSLTSSIYLKCQLCPLFSPPYEHSSSWVELLNSKNYFFFYIIHLSKMPTLSFASTSLCTLFIKNENAIIFYLSIFFPKGINFIALL